MLTFDAPLFALAGLLAAAGPVIVHLWNRRRFKTVAWGAMEFLRQALERHKRAVELRDLLLLILRMLVVCLLGFALARPFLQGAWSSGVVSGGLLLLLAVVASVAVAAAVLSQNSRQRLIAGGIGTAALVGCLGLWGWSAAVARADGPAAGSARLPVHAVLVIDNSRSMGVATTAGTRFDRARQAVRQYLEELPSGSRMTLIPAAGSEQPFPLDAYVSRTDAERALSELTLVDAADDIVAALELAELACQQTSEPESKRVVLVSDLQSPRWNQVDWTDWSTRLPNLQIAPVAEGKAPNVWVESLELEDGFAGAEATSRFLATVRAADLTESTSVDALLRVDGVTIGSQVVELAAGQSRELEFPHQFEVGGEPGRPQWSTATLELRPETPSADRLDADNSKTVLVPVLDAVPVVFIDQYGDWEDVNRGRVGETYALRHLLAPRIAADDAPRRLIQVEHVRPDSVTPELLESARLVVLAGVESPDGLTSVLRDYVVQGGPLVIFAGGEFDPVAWQTHAWLDGRGILPTPLLNQKLGALPTVVETLQPFFIDYASLEGRDFQVEGEDPEMLAALFETTPFFQAIRADVSPETWQQVADQERAVWEQELSFLREQAGLAGGAARSPSDRERLRRLEPSWWVWRSPLPVYPASLTADQVVSRERPVVRARFTEQNWPWAVERRIGRGNVLFFTSGVTSDWNLLRTSGAMYVFHRALFRLMSETLPRRNVVAGERIALPLSAAGDARWELERPSGRKETVTSEVLEAGVTGVVLRRPVTSGVYTLRSTKAVDGLDPADEAMSVPPVATWAVQGPASESQLGQASVRALRDAIGDAPVLVLNVGEPIRLEGGVRRGERLWQWGLLAVLLGLTSEMAVLGGSRRGRSD